MRLLLLGRTGQLAREVLALAGPEGSGNGDLSVTALGRAEADLDDPARALAALRAALEGGGFDAVVNAAAWTAVDKAETEEDAAFRANAEAPGLMAAEAAARGLPFLHVSTDYVFDGRQGPPWREEDSPGPLNAYGRTKLAGERAVLAAGGPGAAVLRTSWVFSAHGSNFVKTMLRLAAERPELRVVDDQTGGPTPASAIAAALVRMARGLSRGEGRGGVFHFAGAPAVTWCGFARAILAEAGSAVPVTGIPSSAYPVPARRPANSVLDCGRIARLWGIAQPDWRAALGPVIAAIRAGA